MNQYKNEKDEFESNFKEYRKKRIVLYGIGRFTATLIPLLDNWNIVGLMDKNPERVGTYVYGLPIMGVSEVKNKADLIIINTAGSYWNLIYQRIKDINIPVFFRNGEKAEDLCTQIKVEYWNSSYAQLQSLIDSNDIVSFDFFDTLFCRRLYMTSEIWEYVGDSCKDVYKKKEFLNLRKCICAHVDKKVPNIYDIYEKIQEQAIHINSQALLEKEMELEIKFIVPRHAILSLMRYALEKEKEVYIISDMYLPAFFFEFELRKYGVDISKHNIWISCDYDCTKKTGELWDKFQKDVVKERKALHIGDNKESDIDNCRNYSKMDTYFIMSQNELLRNSSVRKCLEYVSNDYHNLILGLCMSKLFNDPFLPCKTKGKVVIRNRKEFGYCVFGPIIFSFVYWLMKSVVIDSISHLCFLGRDGYFLKRDFEYLIDLLNMENEVKINYLETSRQILMCAGIENEQDFIEFIKMPYEGCVSEFFEDRLQIELSIEDRRIYNGKTVCLPQDYEMVKEIISHYAEHIASNIQIIKGKYKQYLNNFELNGQSAIVDLGFFGTTQNYLSKILKKKFIGYYIVADNSASNALKKKHILKSCTNLALNKNCKESNLHNMGLALESFLTSPSGMVRAIDKNGKFIYSSDTNNQKFIGDKYDINDGVRLFVRDMVKYHSVRFKRLDIYIDDFIDNWYGLLLKNSIFSEEIKRSFYNDNAFIHRRQERIFERL